MESFTARERAAFNAGIETARQAALTAAVTIEVRDDTREVRQQAAAAALQGLASGLKAAFLDPAAESDPMQGVFAAIRAEAGDGGAIGSPCASAASLGLATASTATYTAIARPMDVFAGCSRPKVVLGVIYQFASLDRGHAKPPRPSRKTGDLRPAAIVPEDRVLGHSGASRPT